MSNPKPPSRNQLFAFLKNDELVRAFEKLFQVVGDQTPADLESVLISAGSAEAKANQALSELIKTINDLGLSPADSKANQALDELVKTTRRAKSNEVLTWLSM